MKKIAVIYWSGTGNTQAMAEAVVLGIEKDNKEVEVNLLNVADATVEDIKQADAIALGCPSMGAEVLEESEMEPFIESISDDVVGKPVVLFGSYDWGTGEWMENWQDRMMSYGAILATDGLTVHLEPDQDALTQCMELGSILVESL